MRFFALIIFFCLSEILPVIAQPEFNYSEIKKKYPDEDACILNDKTSIIIELNKGKLGITEHTETNKLLLNDNAVSYSPYSIFYYDETEDIFNITAASYIPNEKNKLKKTEAGEISEQKPLKENIFYDDYKEIFFRYHGLKNGAVTSLSYSKKFKDPILIDPYYFAKYSPVNEAEFSVTFPKEVHVRYLLAGDTTGIRFSKEENKKTITMTWRAENLDGYKKSYDSYNFKRTFPHIIFYIGEYESEGENIKVLSNNADLFRWFSSHINMLLKEPDENVKALSDSITASTKSDDEKIKKIYYWVQDNIKYIAFEQGLGGFIPRPASLVCSRRYGDCKDKSSLLYALLKAAGIKSYFTWVGTREIPYSYSELSSPYICNHMIISLHNDKGWTFLDGTSNHLPYGLPSFPVQDKEAMISVSADSFAIVKIPVVEKEKNGRTDSVFISLEGKNLTGSGISFFTGFMKNRIDNKYFDVSTDTRDDDMKKMFELGNNKCKTEISGYRGADSFDDSLFCFYKFSIPDYVSTIGKKLFINMNLLKDLQGENIDTLKEIGDRSYYFRSLQNKVYLLKIPENYSVSIIPADNTFNGDGFGFSLHYKIFSDKIILEKSTWIDAISFPKTTFSSWNKMIAAVNEAYSGVVVLEEK